MLQPGRCREGIQVHPGDTFHRDTEPHIWKKNFHHRTAADCVYLMHVYVNIHVWRIGLMTVVIPAPGMMVVPVVIFRLHASAQCQAKYDHQEGQHADRFGGLVHNKALIAIKNKKPCQEVLRSS